MLKLVEEKPKGVICADDMKDGQVGVIVKWPSLSVGVVVQRYGRHLLALGKEKGDGWNDFFACPHSHSEAYLLRLLEKGEILIVD